MAVTEPITVHCPNCRAQVSVTLTVRSVVHDGSSITVNFNTGTTAHHCGAPPMRTGFAAPSRGGTA